MIPKLHFSNRTSRFGEPASPFQRGTKERRLHLYVDDGSLLDGTLPTTVVRDFFGHDLIDVHTTDTSRDPHLEVDGPCSATDSANVRRIGKRIDGTGFVRQFGWKYDLAQRLSQPGADPMVLAKKLVLVDYAELHGSDAFVTSSSEILAARDEGFYRGANIMTPTEAIALTGLFLRLRQDFAYQHHGRSHVSFGKKGFYALLARDLVPESHRWLRLCPDGDPWRSSSYNLVRSVLVRIERALYARDHVHEHHLVPHDFEQDEAALFYFDALLFALSGIFDATARVIHAACGMRDSPRRANWRDKPSKNGSWTAELSAVAPALAQLMTPETVHRDALELVFLLRNSVHGEVLSTVLTLTTDGDPSESLLIVPEADQEAWLACVERLGGRAAWGVRQIDTATFAFGIPVFVEALFPRVLAAADEIMRLTPVERFGGAASGGPAVPNAREARAVERIRLLTGLA